MYRCITSVGGVREYLSGKKIVAFDFETAPDEAYRNEERAALDAHKSHIVGISFSVSEGSAIYVPLTHLTGENAAEQVTLWQWLMVSFFQNAAVIKVAHNLNFETMFLYARGIVPQLPVYDTIAAAQMTLKSNTGFRTLADSGLKTLVPELLDVELPSFADLPSKNIDDNGMFKALTGEDYITAERKNKDPFSFRPYARLLFSCNEIPKNYGDRSDGFYRRLIIIRFDKSVPAKKRDPNLREKLSVERDGILAWALDGLKRLMANSYLFTETERTKAEIQRYKVESNSALMFLEECCEISEKAECIREELFHQYRDFCNKNGMKPLSQTNFNKDVETADERIARGLEKISRRKIWKGIRIT